MVFTIEAPRTKLRHCNVLNSSVDST